jgi:hypothetical protein
MAKFERLSKLLAEAGAKKALPSVVVIQGGTNDIVSGCTCCPQDSTP